MIQRLLLALALALGLGLTAPAFAADQNPLKSVNAHPTTFGTGDTVGVAHGGTGASSAGGTAVDNISGFASTGFITRTGAGAYSFQSTTNGITLGNIAQIAANKVIGNATASTANASPLSMPSCSTATSALTWTTSSGFGCNSISVGTGTVTTTGSPATGNLTKFSGSTSVTNGDLSGDCTTSGTLAITCTKLNSVTPGTFFSQNYATPPAIGGTTPAAGAFTTLSATGNTTTNITGSTQCVQASSSGVLSGTGSACGSGGGGSSFSPFDTGSLTTPTTSIFTLIQSTGLAGTASMANTTRGVVLTTPSATTSDNNVFAYVTPPGSTPYTCTLFAMLNGPWIGQSMWGLGIGDSAGKIAIMGPRSTSGTYATTWALWTNISTFSGGATEFADWGGPAGVPTWVKMVNNGTTLVGSISHDGESYLTIFTLTISGNLGTINKAGIFYDNNPQSTGLPGKLHVFSWSCV